MRRAAYYRVWHTHEREQDAWLLGAARLITQPHISRSPARGETTVANPSMLAAPDEADDANASVLAAAFLIQNAVDDMLGDEDDEVNNEPMTIRPKEAEATDQLLLEADSLDKDSDLAAAAAATAAATKVQSMARAHAAKAEVRARAAAKAAEEARAQADAATQAAAEVEAVRLAEEASAAKAAEDEAAAVAAAAAEANAATRVQSMARACAAKAEVKGMLATKAAALAKTENGKASLAAAEAGAVKATQESQSAAAERTAEAAAATKMQSTARMKSAQAEARARAALESAQNVQAEDHVGAAVDADASRTVEAAMPAAAEESWIAESAIASASDAAEVYTHAQTPAGLQTANKEPRGVIEMQAKGTAPPAAAAGINKSSTRHPKAAMDDVQQVPGRLSRAKSDHAGGVEAPPTRRRSAVTPLPPIKQSFSPMDEPSRPRPVPLKRRSRAGVGLSGSLSMPSMRAIQRPRSTTTLQEDAVLSRPLPTTITMQQLLTERGLTLVSGAQGPTHRSSTALTRHLYRFGPSSRLETSGRWIGTIGLEPAFRLKYARS